MTIATTTCPARALDNLAFRDDELAAIDHHATNGGINTWERSTAEG